MRFPRASRDARRGQYVTDSLRDRRSEAAATFITYRARSPSRDRPIHCSTATGFAARRRGGGGLDLPWPAERNCNASLAGPASPIGSLRAASESVAHGGSSDRTDSHMYNRARPDCYSLRNSERANAERPGSGHIGRYDIEPRA